MVWRRRRRSTRTDDRGASKLRWGILSTGRIARAFAADLRTSESGRLVAVASREVARVTGFGDVRAHGSYEALLDDADVDAVYIATPHPIHARWAIAAAEAGKHVLCEKPLGMDLAEVEAIVDAAQRSGVFLMEAFMYRCHPQTAMLVDLLRSNAIGDVRVIEAIHSFHGSDDPTGRLLARELGGGGILDVGCYCVSGARLVAAAALGAECVDATDVSGAGHIGGTGVDEWAVATMRFDGDIVAHLSTGVRVDQPPRLAIYGSDGSIVLNAPWLPTVGGEPRIVVRRRGHDPQTIVVTSPRALYAYEADVVATSVREGRVEAPFPAPTWADSLANAKALDRWRRRVGVAYESDERPAPIHGRPLRRGSMRTVDVRNVAAPVSAIALGTMVADASADLAVAHGVFDAFYEAGGNTYDTAFIYGDGRSEAAFGAWMASRGVRGDVVVIAKGAHTPHCFPDRIAPQLETSLERLRSDNADIYLLHRDNTDVPVGEFVSALEDLRVAGRIGAYGGSNWTSDRVDEANAWASANGAAGFSVLSNQFSLARMVEPTYEGTLGANEPAFRSWLASRGITNFAWSSQASGFFAGLPEDGFLAHAWYAPDNIERRVRAERLAAERGVDAMTIALAWVLGSSLPIVPIIGPRSLLELRSSLRALTLDLDADALRRLDLEDA
jgi:predicted dehydrogenase/aryl-alcohol dehydrogenase-like predicted oxidoreductase